MKKHIIYIGLLCILSTVIYQKSVRIVELEREIPTVKEIQKKLGVKEDGICGQATREAWDLAICQKYADVFINDKTMASRRR